MMNIELSLLPVVKKNRLEYIINFLLIKDILELVILIGSILAATLIWSWIFLEKDFAALAESAAAVNREYYTYNQDVKDINNVVRNINLANQNFVPITPRLKELISSLPNDIKINSLHIDRRAQTLVITGTALTRSALLNYQNALNKISWITQVETPASQLFQKENINFEFKAKLKNLSLNSQDKTPGQKPAIIGDI
jgi:Tfp pilus assembly protein PilN